MGKIIKIVLVFAATLLVMFGFIKIYLDRVEAIDTGKITQVSEFYMK